MDDVVGWTGVGVGWIMTGCLPADFEADGPGVGVWVEVRLVGVRLGLGLLRGLDGPGIVGVWLRRGRLGGMMVRLV